jgi:hypothetical protein
VEIEQLAEELVGEKCKVLGKMRRAEGAGTVVFAKQAGKETIVGLRLLRNTGGDFAVDQTTEIDFLADASKVDGDFDPWDIADLTVPSPLDPTPPDEGMGISQKKREVGPAQEAEKPKPTRRISPPLLILFVAAALALGIFLGNLLGG